MTGCLGTRCLGVVAVVAVVVVVVVVVVLVAGAGHPQMVQFLLDLGADATSFAGDGKTPLEVSELDEIGIRYKVGPKNSYQWGEF